MFPGYQSLIEDPKAFGFTTSTWEARYLKESGWTFDVNELETLVTDNTKLLVMNVPHNPTGWYPTNEEFNRIISFCKKHDLFLFSDEMYALLAPHDTSKSLNPSACDAYQNAVTLTGMSKTLCCPGLRLGWLATKNEVSRHVMIFYI